MGRRTFYLELCNTMFERLTTGWELAKQSIQVLRLDKELLLFPLFSGIACTLVLGSFALPLWLGGALDSVAEGGSVRSTWVYLLGFAFYFVNYFVIIFFNSALVACAVIRLKGGDPVVRDGVDAALARILQIAGWALVAATVGLILKAIESRSNRFGEIVASLLGMAWSIVTFFVIPVIVIERTNPVDAVRRSTEIMRSHWGESLGANFGIGLMVFLAILLGLLPLGLAIVAFSYHWTVLGCFLALLGGAYLLAVSLISSALQSIIVAALYVYAAEHKAPQHFDPATLDHAFSATYGTRAV